MFVEDYNLPSIVEDINLWSRENRYPIETLNDITYIIEKVWGKSALDQDLNLVFDYYGV